MKIEITFQRFKALFGSKIIETITLLIFLSLLANFLIYKSNFKISLLYVSTDIGSGVKESLPREVVELSLLHSQYPDHNFFALNGSLGSGDLFQRVTEFMYPARYDPKAKFLYSLIVDSPPVTCSLLSQNETIAVYYCP